MDNEKEWYYMVILQERLAKIRQTIWDYGEDSFYIAFSGGKDSTVVSALFDIALPNNKIPRVYCDTGIELNMIRDFVIKKSVNDERIVILKPTKSIKKMLEEDGYPFKSKMHSQYVKKYQTKGFDYKSVRAYNGIENTLDGRPMFRQCPKKLRYQFTDDCTLQISDMCCYRLKEEPSEKWSIENNRPYVITGIMREEGGKRYNAQCLSFVGKKLKSFSPLAKVTTEWEKWFIDAYDIDICDLYKPPYNFKRTGCKGCPFALHLQHELDTLKKYFPAERKQCELIWKPVYEEYRRLNYRLKGDK